MKVQSGTARRWFWPSSSAGDRTLSYLRMVNFRGTSLIRKRTSQDPTVGLCLGSKGGPRGGGDFLWARYPYTMVLFPPSLEAEQPKLPALLGSGPGQAALLAIERVSPGSRKVDARLPGQGNSNSHGARPVHIIITMI